MNIPMKSSVINCRATSITTEVLHQGYNSGAVSVCRVMWPRSESILEYFHSSQKKPQPHEQSPSFPASCRSPRQLRVSLHLPALWTFSIHGIKQNVVLCDWALSLHDVSKAHPRSKYPYTMVNHWRNRQNIFKSGCAILYSQEQHTRVLISLQPPAHLLSGFFFFFFNYYNLPSECELIFHALWFWFAFLW